MLRGCGKSRHPEHKEPRAVIQTQTLRGKLAKGLGVVGKCCLPTVARAEPAVHGGLRNLVGQRCVTLVIRDGPQSHFRKSTGVFCVNFGSLRMGCYTYKQHHNRINDMMARPTQGRVARSPVAAAGATTGMAAAPSLGRMNAGPTATTETMRARR